MTRGVRSSPRRRGALPPLLVTNEKGFRVSLMETPKAFGGGTRNEPSAFADRYAWTPREGGDRG